MKRRNTQIKNLMYVKNESYIKKILNQHILIQEKIDGTRLEIVKQPNGYFKFYKRNIPISLIDRTIIKYYETGIEYLESIDRKNIPNNWRFCFEYMIKPKTVDIKYDHIPKNNLILTDIYDQDGVCIQNLDELNQWSDYLNVNKPAIIFSGNLDTDYKNRLIDYINNKPNFTNKEFLNLFNINHGLLHNDSEGLVEGFLIRSGVSSINVEYNKLLNPNMKPLIDKKIKERKKRKTSDMVSIAILDFSEFVNSIDLSKYSLTYTSFHKNYISLICQIFKEYIKYNSFKYQNTDFGTASFARRPEYDINYKFINDHEIKTLLEFDVTYKDLFKIVLGTFKKKNRKFNNIYNEHSIISIDKSIEKIKDTLVKVKK